jgi:hypothetical protein
MEKTILTSSVAPEQLEEPKNFLQKENYLSEFETEDEKSVVRANLGVYGKDIVYTIDEAELMVNEKIHAALRGYVPAEELPKALEDLGTKIAEAGYVRDDGSVPFTSPQSQTATPTKDQHLTTKIYVDSLLAAHNRANDPHGVFKKLELILADYAKASEVYKSSMLYKKNEVDALLNKYVKRDGSTAFTNPQIGVDPTLPSHLATSRFVRLIMQNHNCEADPHGIFATIKRYLSNYYTKSETYTKAQTYSRVQLLDIIKSQMSDIVEQAISEHVSVDGSTSELKDWIIQELYNFVKKDGSTPFVSPQRGVQAENADEFVVLEQLTSAIDKLQKTLEESIKNQQTRQPGYLQVL